LFFILKNKKKRKEKVSMADDSKENSEYSMEDLNPIRPAWCVIPHLYRPFARVVTRKTRIGIVCAVKLNKTGLPLPPQQLVWVIEPLTSPHKGREGILAIARVEEGRVRETVVRIVYSFVSQYVGGVQYRLNNKVLAVPDPDTPYASRLLQKYVESRQAAS
jgi:hypothetical protein